MGGAAVVFGPDTPTAALARINWGACALAVAQAIVDNGPSVAAVIGWVKKARKIWGGVSGIITAIRSGVAATELGEDASQLLMGILGIGDIVTTCFG